MLLPMFGERPGVLHFPHTVPVGHCWPADHTLSSRVSGRKRGRREGRSSRERPVCKGSEKPPGVVILPSVKAVPARLSGTHWQELAEGMSDRPQQSSRCDNAHSCVSGVSSGHGLHTYPRALGNTLTVLFTLTVSIDWTGLYSCV